MSKISVGDFLSLLRQSNVLTPEQWTELWQARVSPAASRRFDADGLPEGRSDVVEARSTAEIIDWLIDRGWLTRWQADMLLSGRATLFLGKYRLLECIGTGGMGAVFKARHGPMGRTVALKVMSSSVIRKRKGVARFQKEIQAAAALNHPNIVTAFDADCVGNVHFLVMEYVDGHDLGWYVAEKGALPIGWACECIRQAALGLQHAHERGMVHRDIKPTNLLVTRDPESGEPLTKLLDLGLARFSSEAELEGDDEGSQHTPVPELTQAGQVLGTPDYMAPEQATNTRGADARCDIFSLGCTLFRLITGAFPFPGETAAEKIKARQKGKARRLRDIRPEAPPALETIVARMMATDPDQRFQTARDVAVAMAPFSRPDEMKVSRFTMGRTGEKSSGHGVNVGDDPRLRQFFSHLASQATEEPQERSEQKLTLPQLSRKTRIALGGAISCLLLLLAGWHWGGQSTLEIEWPAAQRKQGTLKVNGRDIPLSIDRDLRVSGRFGRWDIRLMRPGYEPITKSLDMSFGQRQQFRPEWQALPQTVRREELAALKTRAAEIASTSAPEKSVDEIRADLIRFRSKYVATEEGDEAIGILGKLASPLDRLSHGVITESALRQAGLGEPKLASESIVSILGAGQSAFWNRIVAMSVSRNGKWFAAASLDGTVRVFDRERGTECQILRLSAEPREMAFSPSSDTLAVALTRREVTLWNVGNGEMIKSLRGVGDPLDFSPDGRILAASRRAEIVLFDADSGQIHRTLTGHPGTTPRILLFSADGRNLVSQGGDSSVAFWDLTVEGEPRRFQRSTRPRLSLDGKLLATGSGDGDLRVWETADGKLHRLLRRGGDPLGFSQDGSLLISFRSGRATIWDVASGEERRVLTGVPNLNVLSPDGTTLAAANPNSSDLRFWSLETGSPVPAANPAGPLTSLAFVPDSSQVITSGADHLIRLWNPSTGVEETTVGPAWGPACSDPDGRLIAVVRVGRIELWDVAATQSPLRILEGDAHDLTQLAWSPSGRLIAGCGAARFLKSAARIWDVESGRELEFDNDQTGAMRAMTFSAGGLRLATVGDSRKTVLWDTGKRSILQTLDGAPERPVALAFDRERKTLAAAGAADAVTLWDLQSSAARSIAVEAKSAIRHLTFGPGGRYLVVAAAGGVQIRDIASGNLLRTLSCRPGAPTWVSLSPSSGQLAAGGNTGTVWVWNWDAKRLPTEEADLKLVIGPTGGLIRQVAWSFDGRHLLAFNGNSTLYVLRLPLEATDD